MSDNIETTAPAAVDAAAALNSEAPAAVETNVESPAEELSFSLSKGTDANKPASIPEETPKEVESWLNSLPDELKAEASLSKFKDLSGLAKSYLEAEKRISGSIKIPGKEATPEELNAFYAKLGRPEAASNYEVNLSTGETLESSPPVAMLAKAAHEAGLNQKQMGAILSVYENIMTEYTESSHKNAEVAKETLQKQWGKDFDNNMAAANVALRQFSTKYPEEMKRLSNDPAVSTNPVILSLFAELGSRMQEGSSVKGLSTGESVNSKIAAQKELESITNNPSHPYWNPTGPKYWEAKKKVDALYAEIYKSN